MSRGCYNNNMAMDGWESVRERRTMIKFRCNEDFEIKTKFNKSL